MGTVTDKLDLLKATKAECKAALIEKGQAVSDEEAFSTYPDKIRAIQTSSGEAPAISVTDNGIIIATAGDKSAYLQLPTNEGGTFTPTSEAQTVASAGDFLTGDIIVGAAAAGSGKEVKCFRRGSNVSTQTTSIVSSSTLSGYTHTITIVLDGFTAAREFLCLYLQYCLSEPNGDGAFTLVLTPYNTSYGGLLTSGNNCRYIGLADVKYEQGENALTITITYRGDSSMATYSAGNVSSSEDYYLYLE